MADVVGIEWSLLEPSAVGESGQLGRCVAHSAELAAFVASAEAAAEPILWIINDGHRGTDTRSAMAAFAARFNTTERNVRHDVLVATGTHRFDAVERRAFEDRARRDCPLGIGRFVWHDATDAGGLVRIGEHRFNRLFSEYRFLLPVGSVEPHYFAGLTGPHKTTTIGCMAYADIERNHAGALDDASGLFQLSGNPVFEDIVGALDDLRRADRRVCGIAEVMCAGAVVDAAVGAPLAVVESLAQKARRVFLRRVDFQADVLHLRVAPPLGNTLYQADKALKNDHEAVRDGGGIVLEARCGDGVGPSAFVDFLRRARTHAEAIATVKREGYRLGDHKGVLLRHLTDPDGRGVRVALVSSRISTDDARVLGMHVFADVEPGLDWLTGQCGPLRRGARVEDAANVVTLHGPSDQRRLKYRANHRVTG